MSSHFKFLNLIVSLFIILNNVIADDKTDCFKNLIVEGTVTVNPKRDLIIILNKGTQKEFWVHVKKYDEKILFCAQQSCLAKVEISVEERILHSPRTLRASMASFLSLVNGQPKAFLNCGIH